MSPRILMRPSALIGLLVLSLALVGVTYSALYVYYPLGVLLGFVKPPLLLDSYPGTSNANYTIGANKTSITVEVKAEKKYQLLNYNTDFDSGPDGWFYYYDYSVDYGSYQNSYFTAVVLDNYNGASNVTLLYGDLNVTASIYYLYYYAQARQIQLLLQRVTIPESSIEGLVLNITHMELVYVGGARFVGSACNLTVGLYDLDQGSYAWYNSSVRCSNAWTTTTYNIDPRSLEPGKSYLLVAGVYAIGAAADFYRFTMELLVEGFFDSIKLYYLPSYPSFSAPIVAINNTDTKTYWALARLEALTTTSRANITIWIENTTGSVQGNISIVNGAIESNQSGPVDLGQASTGYYPGKIFLETSIEPGGEANLTLKLIYGLRGVEVVYPVRITIVDPPTSNINSSSPSQYNRNSASSETRTSVCRLTVLLKDEKTLRVIAPLNELKAKFKPPPLLVWKEPLLIPIKLQEDVNKG